MLEKELSFADLSISLSELYEAMGYADAVPDEAVEKEVRGVLGRVEAVTSPYGDYSGFVCDENGNSLIPEIKNGYSMLIDKQDKSLTNMLERASLNFVLGVYDTDTNTLYYYELDT